MSLGLILIIIVIIYLLGGSAAVLAVTAMAWAIPEWALAASFWSCSSSCCCSAGCKHHKSLKITRFIFLPYQSARIHHPALQESHFCQRSLY